MEGESKQHDPGAPVGLIERIPLGPGSEPRNQFFRCVCTLFSLSLGRGPFLLLLVMHWDVPVVPFHFCPGLCYLIGPIGRGGTDLAPLLAYYYSGRVLSGS